MRLSRTQAQENTRASIHDSPPVSRRASTTVLFSVPWGPAPRGWAHHAAPNHSTQQQHTNTTCAHLKPITHSHTVQCRGLPHLQWEKVDVPVSRCASTTVLFSTSLGPSSMRMGTPRSSNIHSTQQQHTYNTCTPQTHQHVSTNKHTRTCRGLMKDRPVSRHASTTVLFSMSLGPSSMRMGTPRSSKPQHPTTRKQHTTYMHICSPSARAHNETHTRTCRGTGGFQTNTPPAVPTCVSPCQHNCLVLHVLGAKLHADGHTTQLQHTQHTTTTHLQHVHTSNPSAREHKQTHTHMQGTYERQTCVTPCQHDCLVLHVLGAQLHAHGHTAQL
jgi:hypothetical protein